jgi:nitric oxide reductase activation protein
VDTTLAAAVVIDESGSMCGELHNATRVMVAITEPLDGLGCPVQVSGFRDGQWGNSSYPLPGDQGDYHRHNGIVHDIFKWFDEPFRTVKWRFANTRATGGTPMADGVQFGLDALARREETHKVLFIVTDGQPNGGHMPIIKRQCRLAKAAGIHVIGVGLGSGAMYVQKVFPDSVWTATMAEMPKALIAKLNALVDQRVWAKSNKRTKIA